VAHLERDCPIDMSGTLRSIATYCAAAAKVPVSQASQDVGLQDVAQVP